MGNVGLNVADLEIALTSVRDRIAKFRGQAIGEENTKHALIEPVLRALGWDVEDLDEVRCEYKLKAADNPVDYAFFVHGNLRLFVEAKALGENLDRWANTIMGYAGVAGVVEWIVLTDGNEYRIYNAHAQVPIAQKLFKRVVLASDEPDVQATLLLLSKAQLQGTVIDDLWRQYFVDRQVKQAVEGLSGIEPASDFLRLIRRRVSALSLADVRQSLGRATLSLDYRAAQPALTPPAGRQDSSATGRWRDRSSNRTVGRLRQDAVAPRDAGGSDRVGDGPAAARHRGDLQGPPVHCPHRGGRQRDVERHHV